MTTPVRLALLVKSQLYDDLKTFREALLRGGSACRMGAGVLEKTIFNNDQNGTANVQDALMLRRWTARHARAITSIDERLQLWKHLYPFINVANADFLTPILHVKGSSITTHHAVVQQIKHACDALVKLVAFVDRHPFGEISNGRKVSKGGQSELWLNIDQFAEWKARTTKAWSKLQSFHQQGWEKLLAQIEIEHWRTVAFILNNKLILESKPKRIRKRNPEIEARNAAWKSMSDEGKTYQQIAAIWNRKHPLDNVSADAVKKAVLRWKPEETDK